MASATSADDLGSGGAAGQSGDKLPEAPDPKEADGPAKDVNLIKVEGMMASLGKAACDLLTSTDKLLLHSPGQRF